MHAYDHHSRIAFVYMGFIFVCMYLGIVLKSEHIWVFKFWLYCISCTYGKRKKEVHKKTKKKVISGKSQNFIELLSSAQPSSRNEHFVSPSKNLLKNRNWTFPVVCRFTWKLEFVSNILWMILASSQVEHRFNMG